MRMLEIRHFTAQDLQGLSAEESALIAAQLSQHFSAQSRHIEAQRQQIIDRDRAIKFRDAKIESITFQLARFKAWKFGAKTEAMNAEQRSIFEETCAADEAQLQAQLDALRGSMPASPAAPQPKNSRQPKRAPLPEHLPRVEQRIEPEDTNCPEPHCGQPMQRVGEDVSERLDIIPAQFIVQCQIRGKWACKCCQVLVQEPAAPQVFDNALPTPGLQAHTVISRFVDHLPYYRQEQINARAGVHTPRSTLAAWGGQTGAQLLPLYNKHRAFVLACRVLHADETPMALLDPGRGKTKTGYMWAYARSGFDAEPGVVYDFCAGRGSKYPVEFLQGWDGTLVADAYAGYDAAMAIGGRTGLRISAGCMAHARRKFDELVKANASEVAAQAIQRIAGLYRVEAQAGPLLPEQRLQMRQANSRPMCEELHLWLKLERNRVPDGSAIAKALDYSLNHWAALTRFLQDGAVPIDNNHIENQMRPWAMGRKNWLFIGSELAGERAAVVMSLLQSAKLNGHDPFAYLKDVLTRLPTHLNSRIDELLPHRWRPGR